MNRRLRPRLSLFVFGIVLAVQVAVGNAQTPATDNTFTVQRNGSVSVGCVPQRPNQQSIDLAHIEFNDNGTFAKAGQLDNAVDCITQARKNPNGAVVVLFVHGWHHNAAWTPSKNDGDEHFASFRRILMSLALREAERYSGGVESGRRVVGVYLGWNGDPQSGFFGFIAKYVSTYPAFFERYKVAETIAAGTDIRETVRRVIAETKTGSGPDSPLALIGHSMGAMILEMSLEALVRQDQSIGASRSTSSESCVHVERNGQPAVFPDLVLLLNSAADADTSRSLITLLDQKRIRKVGTCDGRTFHAPLIIAATSLGDTATRDWFRRAKPGHATAANTPSLLTHRLTGESPRVRCLPRPLDHLATDYEQTWHCLRSPSIANDQITDVAIDLPRANVLRNDCHTRYRLLRTSTSQSVTPYWLLQLETAIVSDHNDIFNRQASLLIMSFMQLSGSIVSVAKSWSDLFDPDQGPC